MKNIRIHAHDARSDHRSATVKLFGVAQQRVAVLACALILAALVVCAPTLIAISDDAWGAQPIDISSAEGLSALSDAINRGGTAEYPLNGTYRLTNDINLSSIENWTPIGYTLTTTDEAADRSFRGTFDGNGYTISNLTITNFNAAQVGLFGCTNDATIINLNLVNTSIKGTSHTSSALSVGPLVGLGINTNISRCSVAQTVLLDKNTQPHTSSDTYSFGGMVGSLVSQGKTKAAIVDNCSVVLLDMVTNTPTATLTSAPQAPASSADQPPQTTPSIPSSSAASSTGGAATSASVTDESVSTSATSDTASIEDAPNEAKPSVDVRTNDADASPSFTAITETPLSSSSTSSTAEETQPTPAYAGGIVGMIQARTEATLPSLTHCSFEGSLKANGFVGPLVAAAYNEAASSTPTSTAGVSGTEASKVAVNTAGNQLECCFYAGSFSTTYDSFLNGDYTDNALWTNGIYQRANRVTASSTDSALATLRGAEKGYAGWRIANLDNGASFLTLDFRRIQSADYTKLDGQATISAHVTGTFGTNDLGDFVFEWTVDGKAAHASNASGSPLQIPLTSNEQTVVVNAKNAQAKTAGSATLSIGAAEGLQLNTTKNIDPNNPATTTSFSATTLPLDNEPESTVLSVDKKDSDAEGNAAVDTGFTDSTFNYLWYGVDGDSTTQLNGASASTATLKQADFGDYRDFKVVATSRYASDVSIEAYATNAGKTIFLDSAQGKDSNDGLATNRAVRTLAKAYEKLDSAADGGSVDNNTIVVMYYGNAVDGNTASSGTFTKPATLTSKYQNIDYRSTRSSKLICNNNNSNINGIKLFANTAFKDVIFRHSSNSIGYIYCQGNSLTMDTGITMENFKTQNDTIGLISGTRVCDFNIVGGFLDYDQAPGAGYNGEECTIVIKSGSYSRIIGGGRNSKLNTTSHNQFGSEEKPFRVNITIDIANSLSSGAGTNCDVGLVCGGQTDGTIYAQSSLTVKNGIVPLVLGSSIGYPRDCKDGYPNNDFVGTTQVIINGGQVAQLYGGCLGRYTGSQNLAVDSRFKAIGDNTNPDIAITITGGTLGAISGINTSLTGVFAAGAGGITGELANDGSVSNHVDIHVSVSGGTINGSLFGGGYGESPGVSAGNARYACTEAGNLYGNTTLDIIGGTINADIYGGGAGTTTYLENNSNTSALAQVVGNVSTNISNSRINGSIYGGGRGVSNTNATATDDMARITGNVSLSIENSTINGSVFGGSALGTITGNTVTTITGVASNTISGSVYGGGQGQMLAGTYATVERQRPIGHVAGTSTLTLAGYDIKGSVYGGGQVGIVGGNTTSTLVNCSVEGSIYGGGQGAIAPNAPSNDFQNLFGLVSGSATTTLKNTVISSSVFGGGALGAVLGNNGTTVIMSGGSIGGSAYAAGEGKYIENNSNIELQKLIGWVQGNATITLKENATVSGDVFGGGNLGATGNGALTSDSIPYSITKAANIAVTIEKATINGSVFGGGAGLATASGQHPRILGACFGTSTVKVHEATIGADVFGGGDQSYSYAPLNQSGQPQQATKVIINGGNSIYVNALDGSVAFAAGSGIEAIDVVSSSADANTPRTINLGGSVFGGGNIADAYTVSANNITVFGNTALYVKGQNTNFTSTVKGGVYGDGNLSRASGKRFVTLIDLRNASANNDISRKSFFSLQRADRAIVNNCNIFLKGAKDLVNESDTTRYSLNRIGNLMVYSNSTLQFDTVVNGLGNLWSDVLPERTFTKPSTNLPLTTYGDNLTDSEKASYRNFAQTGAGTWQDAEGVSHSTTNTIILNSGRWLDVKQSADIADASYGAVTGLFSLVSNTAAEGGAFVFAKHTPADSTGTFVSLNREAANPLTYLNLYTQAVSDIDGKDCRIWFIEGNRYEYARDLKTYTTGVDAQVMVYLPVDFTDTATTLSVDGPVVVSDSLKDMRISPGNSGAYTVSLTLGDTTHGISNRLPLYKGTNTTWSYDYSPYVSESSPTGLIPATIAINFGNFADELDAQSGPITFTLKSVDGRAYRVTIDLSIEKSYASATKSAHYGKIYDNIPVENMTPITRTSSYTSQFVTTYSPGAYRGGIKTYLTTNATTNIHGQTGSSWLPPSTKITMVDYSNPLNPVYYYFESGNQWLNKIDLQYFRNEATGTFYKNPTGNTVIVENLLFIVDFSEANYGSGQTDPSPTYLTLDHRSISTGKDILRYTRTDNAGHTTEHYNTLVTAYPIAYASGSNYLQTTFLDPDSGASSNQVKVGHSDNFMYDTYTTTLRLNTPTSYISTKADESQVMLALNLDCYYGYRYNNTFPLGSIITVTDQAGVQREARYFNDDTTGRGYYLVDLGNNPQGNYTINMQVNRYLDGASLYTAFPSLYSYRTFSLYANLFYSSDGLCYDTEGVSQTGSAANNVAYFAAARANGVAAPVYEFLDGGQLLTAWNGKVSGTLRCINNANGNNDVAMTVLRRNAGQESGGVDITKVGGSVLKNDSWGYVSFSVTDTPPAAGQYTYEFRLGNTVYYQDVTVS